MIRGRPERVLMRSKLLWLIVKQRHGGPEVLTIDGRVLPVFSFREKSEAYLRLGGADSCWRASETTCGELVSVLYGPCREAERVCLDPLPEMVELVSMSRNAFVEALLASNASSAVGEAHTRRGNVLSQTLLC